MRITRGNYGLAVREASYGLTAGEKRMLAKARLILLQEG